jgi:hypothetical protein
VVRCALPTNRFRCSGRLNRLREKATAPPSAAGGRPRVLRLRFSTLSAASCDLELAIRRPPAHRLPPAVLLPHAHMPQHQLALCSALITASQMRPIFPGAEPDIFGSSPNACPTEVAMAKINRFVFVLHSPIENQSSSLRSGKANRSERAPERKSGFRPRSAPIKQGCLPHLVIAYRRAQNGTCSCILNLPTRPVAEVCGTFQAGIARIEAVEDLY